MPDQRAGLSPPDTPVDYAALSVEALIDLLLTSPDPDEDAGDLTINIQDDMDMVVVTQDGRGGYCVGASLRDALIASLVDRDVSRAGDVRDGTDPASSDLGPVVS